MRASISAARQGDVAHEGVRDDLAPEVDQSFVDVEQSVRLGITSLPCVVRVLPDDAAALAEADAHRR